MHKTSKIWAALLVATMGVASAQAETLRWTSGATTAGDFTSAANWSPTQAPQPGDTLIVNDAVTFAATTFDVGTAGLTIESAAKVKVISNVAFTGSGDMVIHSKSTDWQGGFFQKAACPSHTGDWHIYDGIFEPQAATLGSGTVHVESGESNAQLQIGNTTFKNDIQIVGQSTKPAINFSNAGTLTGVVSSDADFTINIAYVYTGGRATIQNLQGGGGGQSL